MAQNLIASLLAVATVYIGLWTLILFYFIVREGAGMGGAYLRDSTVLSPIKSHTRVPSILCTLLPSVSVKSLETSPPGHHR